MTSSTSCLSLTYDLKPDITGIRFWHFSLKIKYFASKLLSRFCSSRLQNNYIQLRFILFSTLSFFQKSIGKGSPKYLYVLTFPKYMCN